MGYFVTDKDKLCSEKGDKAVDDFRTCGDASRELTYDLEDTIQNKADMPKGCYLSVDISSLFTTFFNVHPVGSSNKKARQICKPKPKSREKNTLLTFLYFLRFTICFVLYTKILIRNLFNIGVVENICYAAAADKNLLECANGNFASLWDGCIYQGSVRVRCPIHHFPCNDLAANGEPFSCWYDCTDHGGLKDCLVEGTLYFE